MAVERTGTDVNNVCKILLIGDSGVGKSGLLLRFTEDAFKENYHSTIGAEFKTRTLDLNGKSVKLEICDTSGQERYRAITNNYYRKIHGIMLVYDITNVISYTNLDLWLDAVARNTDPDVRKMLIGNKSDLTSETVVDSTTAKNYADILGIPFLQTSVKYSINVEEAFKTLASEVLDMLKNRKPQQTESPVTLYSTKPHQDKRLKLCCKV